MADRRYIEDMRQRLGLKPDDASLDGHIEKMTAEQRLALLCGWHLGDPNWSYSFLSWARDAGFKITEPHQ
ncbi:hypothetical protein ACWX0K_20560 [Nitrobacteraceae bacterium UC4446_H13]